MISLSVPSLPKDVQEPRSYILSGAFDYVFDHREERPVCLVPIKC